MPPVHSKTFVSIWSKHLKYTYSFKRKFVESFHNVAVDVLWIKKIFVLFFVLANIYYCDLCTYKKICDK